MALSRNDSCRLECMSLSRPVRSSLPLEPGKMVPRKITGSNDLDI